MTTSTITPLPLLATLLATLGCGADLGIPDRGEDDETGEATGETDNSGNGESEPSGEDGGDICELDCGLGICVNIDGNEYCECPEDSDWTAQGCAPCPVVDAAGHDLALPIVSFSGDFTLRGAAPPKSEYDDANLWLENPRSNDRVWLGNTHDGSFSVRVTPGVYDIVYELETPGPLLPRNPRVRLQTLALFSSLTQTIDIPAASVGGEILLNGAPPPASEYDDANIWFRERESGEEVLAGNTHDRAYAVTLVSGVYDIVYRSETPGPITPHNHGAVLGELELGGDLEVYPISINSVTVTGDFMINGEPAPASEYDDANIELESEIGGVVALGNTHDGSYTRQIIPGQYTFVYRHENGKNVPQNQRARFLEVQDLSQAGTAHVDIPMIELSGAITINGAAPPASDYDDGVLHLRRVGSDDSVLLGNTHAGSYQLALIPGSYEVDYAQQTSGGTVPQNKQARVASLDLSETGEANIDIAAVPISGTFTLGGEPPPASQYEKGWVYLRSASGDAVLLGSTHAGGYAATVVPGDYDIFYVQDTAGSLLPANQNASLTSVTIAGPMGLDIDIPALDLSGQIQLTGGPAPADASDGGQLYLRGLAGDSVLLGDSFAPVYAVKLVAGTYGVYYRSEASVTMPQNQNGRFACVTVE